MSTYAIVNNDGIVVNTIIWDGESKWDKPEGMNTVLYEGNGPCVIGGTYLNGVFSPPAEVLPPKSERIADAENIRESLLSEATSAIAPLQDAVDLGIATNDEVKKLTSWKKYRVLVNRTDTSNAPDVNWPEKPQA